MIEIAADRETFLHSAKLRLTQTDGNGKSKRNKSL